MKEEIGHRELPKNFWGLLAAAVLFGNIGLLVLLWLGVPAWIAASVPTAAVGFIGVVFAYRERIEKRGIK